MLNNLIYRIANYDGFDHLSFSLKLTDLILNISKNIPFQSLQVPDSKIKNCLVNNAKLEKGKVSEAMKVEYRCV